MVPPALNACRPRIHDTLSLSSSARFRFVYGPSVLSPKPLNPVMPIDETSHRFVPALRKLGYDVTFREYDGRHNVPEPIVREAFTWFMSGGVL